MGLKKSVDLEVGVTAEYWKIIQITVDYIGQRAQIEIALYLHKQARDTNKFHLDTKIFNLISPQFLESNDLRAVTYSLLKELPEFTGAEDV